MRIAGYEEEEIMGIHYPALIHPRNLDETIKFFSRQFIKELENTYLEYAIITKDGREVWLGQNTELILEDGIVKGFQAVSRDITDRKLAEDEVRESKEKYRALVENIEEVIFSLDTSGQFTYISPAIERISGLKPEDIIGKNFSEFVHPEDLPFLIDSWKRTMSGASEPFEFRVFKEDQTRYVLTTSQLIAEGGVTVGVTGIMTDITERKRAEEALRESEELYRTIFETTGTSMILIEEDMTISMANEEFVRNSEYSPDEINGRMKWPEIVHPDDLGRMVEQHRLRRTSHGGALSSYEFRYITKSGQVMDTFLTIKLVPGTKKSIASLMNISERKKAEDKLQQTLESLRKAIGTTIHVLVSAVESRDPYTAGHQSRSADLACAIAKEMGLDQNKIEGIHMAGIIHDIGKLSIPAEILSKPTKLTVIEFALIKEHSRSGYEMLKDVESPWPLAEIVYQHHERMNGSGYPRNLKGDEILMESQILAVADVVEAMASHRPYRPTLGIEAALEEIEKNKGILYDDIVANVCLRLFREKGYQLA
jgi:PAS domain S-box-containing protein